MYETISWQAPEHEHQEHTADWYWAVGIIAVSFSIGVFIVGNILFSVVILLGIGTLLVHAKTPPKIISCGLSRKGILAGKTLYSWESLESFCIIEEHRDENIYRGAKIILISKKPFMPHIVVPLDQNVAEDVHEALSQKLPEEPHQEPLPDRIMRRLGF